MLLLNVFKSDLNAYDFSQVLIAFPLSFLFLRGLSQHVIEVLIILMLDLLLNVLFEYLLEQIISDLAGLSGLKVLRSLDESVAKGCHKLVSALWLMGLRIRHD